MAHTFKNLIPNHDFSKGKVGQLPDFWEERSPRPGFPPIFQLVQEDKQRELMICGNGDGNCVGCLRTSFLLIAGKTYQMKVQFRLSKDMNPFKNLLFAFYSEGFNNGIFNFSLANGQYIGENSFFVPGEGEIKGEIQVYFRMSGSGKAWIETISFEECSPIPHRYVKAACVEGTASLEDWEQVLDFIGKKKVDLVLLPEIFRSTDFKDAESLGGPSVTLMSKKAKQYGMYVSGTFYHLDDSDSNLYNTGVIMDRDGTILGRYDKIHLYSPEMLEGGVTSGNSVRVFETDFGKIGLMICYDSWFTDVAELLALRGAEMILFPNAGYYQSIMPARSADNCVRIIASSLFNPMGMWDTTGAEVRSPNADPTRFANCEDTFRDVCQEEVCGIKILFATFDLNSSPSPHNWGGPMRSAPGGRRNRREQKKLLLEEIQSEIERLNG